MTDYARFARYNLDAELTNSLESVGLASPEINVDVDLARLLARSERSVEVNETALYQGSRAIELETPMIAEITAPPNGSRKTPMLGKTYVRPGWGQPHTFNMAVDAKIENITDETIQNVNRTFWAGVLAIDALAQHSSQSYSPGRVTTIKASSIVVAAGASATTIVTAAAEHVPYASSWPTIIGAAVLANILRKGYVRHRLPIESSFRRLARKNTEQADELARRHKVLLYGVPR